MTWYPAENPDEIIPGLTQSLGAWKMPAKFWKWTLVKVLLFISVVRSTYNISWQCKYFDVLIKELGRLTPITLKWCVSRCDSWDLNTPTTSITCEKSLILSYSWYCSQEQHSWYMFGNDAPPKTLLAEYCMLSGNTPNSTSSTFRKR